MANKRKMSDEEKQEWEELYNYVKGQVLSYDDAQTLSKQMVLRLKGMRTGKFMENKRIEDKAKYTYRTVLYTFKACMPKIASVLSTKTFNSESHKFNYICAIIENNINDIYLREMNAKKAKEKIEKTEFVTASHEGADYKSKTQKTTNSLDDLW